MDTRIKVAIIVEKQLADTLFVEENLAMLHSFADTNDVRALPETITPAFMMECLQGAQACISCWRTPAFTDEMLAQLPDLAFIAHAAGSVRRLVPPSFWSSGRRITSNAMIIGEDVAQTTLTLILASLKNLWTIRDSTRAGAWEGGDRKQLLTRRLDGLNVGIVGASIIGKLMLPLLRPFRCNLFIADPYLSPLEAKRLGATLLPLDEMIALSDVLTLHAPAREDCRHILNARNIPLIRDNAVLVNTARGMLIDEDALVRELRTGRFMACLDVTDPEPPAPDHPFRTLDNVALFSHVAGGHTLNGRAMMGDNVITEIYNYFTKGLIAFEVRPEMLRHMA